METKIKQIAQQGKTALEIALSHTIKINPMTKLRQKAVKEPELVFNSIAHLLTPELLKESFEQLNKKAAVGIDEVSYEEYQLHLQDNILKLQLSLKNRSYEPKGLKRIWIDKGNGKKRPIGISAIEDKIVQRAVTTLLNQIYEPDFYDFSYGFREKRSAHQALKYFRNQSMRHNINWFINADIKGCFDNFSHKIMLEILNKRVNDGTINRLINKWMRTEIIDGKEMTVNDEGTPQGGIISPLLANVYLHEVVDKWLEEEIQPLLRGAVFIVRYADDFIIGLQHQSDAEQLYKVLPKRLSKYGLELSLEKSRLQNFVAQSKEDNNTIDYLGFTHYWTKSRLGSNVIKRKTKKKSKIRILKELYQTIKANRHFKLHEQHKAIRSKLRGYYGYYAIRGNYPFLNLVYYKARLFWMKMLNHRGGRKNSYNKDSYDDLCRIFVLPKPKILHQI